MFEEYTAMIAAADRCVYEVARRTSLDYVPRISERMGNRICLKREDQQPVFSYKLRGAYNLIKSLDPQRKKTGVIAASAGNHGQGVALAAKRQGSFAVIVLPKSTPQIKIDAVRRLGAEIVMHGGNFDEANAQALKIGDERGLTYIPPFDHPMIIAGQATVGLEIMQQHPVVPDIIFVPVGGGGLIAGIALAVKQLNPDVRIIGVEPDEAPSMYEAFKAKMRVPLESIGVFADGAAVRQAGAEPFRIAQQYVEEILLVDIDEICASVKDIFEDTRSIPEPAGALALAGLKKYVQREGIAGRELVAIFSGANVNFDRLRHIAELAALGSQHEVLIGSPLPERPGSFKQFCHLIGTRSITEFNYRYSDSKVAHVFAGVRLRDGKNERIALMEALRKHDYEVVDLSENELAKMHIRYMVGGHAPQASNERLCRFEFPERPGALLYFLNQLGERWNISLFHYRNHGAAYGRVFVGIQVPDAELEEFQSFLDELPYRHWFENSNVAYTMFLS
ncbi:MAG: threonine ammonia-lyase, biosynthetic [Candidatus Eutrophobiaceae bacterium]